MMNYRNVLNDAKLILKKSSILTAELDAEILLSISLKEKREKILLNLENRISSEQLCNFYKLVDIRKKKVPISIIAGKKSFWKSDFIVNRDVLTPRFETELLVEKVLKINNKSTKINVLDIGIGSGCILISLLQDRKNWRGTGIDPSKEAIKIAKINAKIQQVYDRIHFINSNIDNFIGGKYDLIVSNPPYINKIGYSNLDKSVKEYEPRMALYGGIDGSKIIEKIILKSKKILKNSGLLVMEIGLGQKFKVSELLKKNGFNIDDIVKDYQNIDRCIVSKKVKQ